jgi:putative membrane protein
MFLADFMITTEFDLPNRTWSSPTAMEFRFPVVGKASGSVNAELPSSNYLPHRTVLPMVTLPPPVLPGVAVAYVHTLSFMVCFAALVLERKLIRPDPGRTDAIALVVTDVVYGIAALAVVLSGILRVLRFGRGVEFYTQNPLFWLKVGIFVAVGVVSLYPTFIYILWANPLRKGELPQVSEALATRLRWFVSIELLAFAAIPLLASLMARGVGLTP